MFSAETRSGFTDSCVVMIMCSENEGSLSPHGRFALSPARVRLREFRYYQGSASRPLFLFIVLLAENVVENRDHREGDNARSRVDRDCD